MIEGGCFCGKIQFTIDEKQDGSYLVANCHCSMCRRTSAAPFVTWIIAPRTALHLREGNPAVLHSSEKGTRHFCRDCGTPLFFHTTDRPQDVDVTTCCLDNPDKYVPTVNVYEESRLQWLPLT